MSDFEGVTQFWHAQSGSIEKIIGLGSHTHRPSLNHGVLVGEEAKAEVSGSFTIQREPIHTLAGIRSERIFQREMQVIFRAMFEAIGSH